MLSRLQLTTAQELFEKILPQCLDAGWLADAAGRVEFRIESDAFCTGGTWLLDLDERVVAPAPQAGEPKPHVIVRAAARDLMALVDGTMSASDGLLTERLHVAGDVVRVDKLMQALTSMGSRRLS